MKISGIYIIILLFSFQVTLHAQTPSLTIGTVTACGAQEVLVPVNAENLLNVGAISLHIRFDSTKISFISVDNIDSQLLGYLSNLMVNPPRVGFAWSNIIPANFIARKLFDLKFTFTGNRDSLIFNPECEIATADIPPQVINVSWTHGGIVSGIPDITINPADTVVQQGQTAIFHTMASNATNYTWKESANDGLSWNSLQDGGKYAGTHTTTLTISNVQNNLNGNKYYCLVDNGQCQNNSAVANLEVDSISAVHESLPAPGFYIRNYPNPFAGSTSIEYLIPESGNINIFVTDCSGKMLVKLVSSSRVSGKHTLKFNAEHLAPGVYYCNLDFSNNSKHITLNQKLIILPTERNKN